MTASSISATEETTVTELTNAMAVSNDEEDNEGPDLNISKLVLVNNVYSQEWRRSTPLKTYSKKTATSTPNMAAVSRYGRSHKPRIADGFLSTDKKVSQYLKIDADNQLHYFKSSPYSVYRSPNSKSTCSSISSGSNSQQSSPRKRGRPRKIRTLSDSGIANVSTGIASESINSSDTISTTTTATTVVSTVTTKKRFSVGHKLPANTTTSLQPPQQQQQRFHQQHGVAELNVPIPTSTQTLPIPPELMDQAILGSSDIEESEEILTELEDTLDLDPLDTSPAGTTVEMGPDGQPRWMVGDLAWACVGGFPYWPCTVTRDPFENAFTKLKFIGKFRQARDLIHVRFFGDHGRRSWIYKGNILPFQGLDAFLTLAEQKCTPKIKKKFPKLYRSFSVTTSVRKAWQAAVSEAESLKEAPRSERVKYFMEAFPQPITPITQSQQPYGPATPDSRTPVPVTSGKRGRKSLQWIKENQAKTAAKKRKSESALGETDVKKFRIDIKEDSLDEEVDAPIHIIEKIKEEPESVQKKMAKNKPRKNSNKGNSSLMSPLQTESEVNLTKIKQEIPPKRPRGRPRKYPKLEPSETLTPPSSATSTPTPTPTTTGKKKVGRKSLGVNRKSDTPNNSDTKISNNGEKKTPQSSSQLPPQAATTSLEQTSLAASDSFFQQERKKSKLGPGFASFCEKHFDQVADEDPSLTANDVNKYLEKMWLQLSDAVKARYRSKIQEEIDVESESDTETDDRPSPPQIVTPGGSNNNKPINKRGVALFSGVKSEKVCSICFKSSEAGEVIKCKGSCCNYFHLECSTRPRYQQSRFGRQKTKKKGKRGRPRTVNKLEMKEEDLSLSEEANVSKQSESTLRQANGDLDENLTKQNTLTDEDLVCINGEPCTKLSAAGDETNLAASLPLTPSVPEQKSSKQGTASEEKHKNSQKENIKETATKEEEDEDLQEITEFDDKTPKKINTSEKESVEIEKSNKKEDTAQNEVIKNDKKQVEVDKSNKESEKAVKSNEKVEEAEKNNKKQKEEKISDKKTEEAKVSDKKLDEEQVCDKKQDETLNSVKKSEEVAKNREKKFVKEENVKVDDMKKSYKKTEGMDKSSKTLVEIEESKVKKLDGGRNNDDKSEDVEKSAEVEKNDLKLDEKQKSDKKTTKEVEILDKKQDNIKNSAKNSEEVEKSVKKSNKEEKSDKVTVKSDKKSGKVEKRITKVDKMKRCDKKPEKIVKSCKISEKKDVKKAELVKGSDKKQEVIEQCFEKPEILEKADEEPMEVTETVAEENEIIVEDKMDEDSQSESNLVINESSNDEDVEMQSVEEATPIQEKEDAEVSSRKVDTEKCKEKSNSNEKLEVSLTDKSRITNKEKENLPSPEKVDESSTKDDKVEKEDTCEKSTVDSKKLTENSKEEATKIEGEVVEQTQANKDSGEKGSASKEKQVEVDGSEKETSEKNNAETKKIAKDKETERQVQSDETLLEPKQEDDSLTEKEDPDLLEKDLKMSEDEDSIIKSTIKEDPLVEQVMDNNKVEGNVDGEVKLEGLKLQDLKSDKRESANDDKQSVDSDKSNDKQSIDSDKSQTGKSGWMCNLCVEGKDGPCFICGVDTGDLIKCSTTYCGKVYHLKCLASWPQRQIGQGAKGRLILYCPQHTCHTCISDNPAVHTARFSSDKLVRCVACPSSYHYGNYCIPAGSELLSTTQMICPRHYVPLKDSLPHLNASWCSICAIGGSLICCDSCPNSFHAECLKIDPPEGSFICEDCETGRIPLYGEVVWVKLGAYRWWPAKILYPMEVPENIRTMSHAPVGEFVVEFFGSHDYFWINRGRAFFYHEGDGANILCKNRVDELFKLGMNEASEAFRQYQEERESREANCRPSMKPPKYVKIQTNKPYGTLRSAESDVASMTACECDPEKENPCGRNSDCINRLLMVECNPQICPAGEKCQNQNFEKRFYPPLTPFKTETRGWGLKTLVPLKKGDFVIEYVGEMIDEEEYKRRVIRKQKNKDENYYFLTIDKDRMLDAGPKGNMARFMNHSCNPNCETQKWTVNGDTRVGLFTLADIEAGMELVFNYNLETIGNTRVDCKCGAPSCGGYIGAKAIKPEEKKTTVTTNSKKKKQPKKSVGNGSSSNKSSSTSSSSSSTKVTENTCFTCGEGGELLLCDHSSCPKAYHLDCLGLTKHPPGNWECPRHVCSICSSTKVQRCTHCINSYCDKHAEGNITLHRSHGLVCFSCTPSESGSDWSGEPSEDEESANKKPEIPQTVTITKTSNSSSSSNSNNKSNKLLTSRRGRPIIPNGNLH
ncbi:nuclear receptor binding SET domain protein isoform X3 [Rhodnius prolixus]|uniref:nuclear receptor binding SET domain protein isoform X3 n=1 Tax=Rhodnius prolixus TaxID=13249 RepID=UPI003D18E09B